jgi:hypothetical protein
MNWKNLSMFDWDEKESLWKRIKSKIKEWVEYTHV